MDDNQGQIVSSEEAILAGIIVHNEKFRRMIWRHCEIAVGMTMIGPHLSNRHSVNKDMTKRIANMIGMGEWGCIEGRENKLKKPLIGSRPQEWLMMSDMLQCKGCREFHARSVNEVESHWNRVKHGTQRKA